MILFTIPFSPLEIQTPFSPLEIQQALLIAVKSGNEYGCRWAAHHPETSEEILIELVSQKKLNHKIRVAALIHKNATDKVAEAISSSVSVRIFRAVLQSPGISDEVKSAWMDSTTLIKKMRDSGYRSKEPYENVDNDGRIWSHPLVWNALSDPLKKKLSDRLKEQEERYAHQWAEYQRKLEEGRKQRREECDNKCLAGSTHI